MRIFSSGAAALILLTTITDFSLTLAGSLFSIAFVSACFTTSPLTFSSNFVFSGAGGFGAALSSSFAGAPVLFSTSVSFLDSFSGVSFVRYLYLYLVVSMCL